MSLSYKDKLGLSKMLLCVLAQSVVPMPCPVSELWLTDMSAMNAILCISIVKDQLNDSLCALLEGRAHPRLRSPSSTNANGWSFME